MITFRPPSWPKHYSPRKGTVYTSTPKGDRQLVDVMRGRDYDAAEAEYETLEPPVEVEPHPPVAPSAGFNLIDLIAEVLTDHGIAYGECLAPVIAEALLDQYQDAALAAQKFRNPK